METIAELDDVKKSYVGITAVENISLRLKEGEVVGLLGHNGAGKTTTMKLFLGLISATHGNVRIFGESPTGTHATTLRKNLGYLPENVSFYPQLSGREVLRYLAKLKGVSLSEQEAILERVGLSRSANKRIKTFSKGMRQRLGLAQALLGKPKLLLFDEPTAGLDPSATVEFYTILDELRKQGTAVLISSHVLPGIEKHIDRAVILRNGQLLANGTLDELNNKANLPLNFRVAGKFNNSTMQQQLSKHDTSISHFSENCFELVAPRFRKLEILRMLLADKNIKDVEIKHPTLDDLYIYYNQRQGEGQS